MNPMQKKKLISIAIALTLQSYYIPAIAAENNDDEKECPSNISSLPKEKRAKLSPTCLATPENDNHWGWVAGGVAALVAGVAIGVENNGGGDSNHSYTPPTPDNGGDVTPPDDGGNVTPPDDGGDDNVIPPDDSGDDDVTPPDDSGDDDVTPPDDSGDDDVTPPDDSGDDDVTPPDDSGDDDVTPPDDSGDDDVTPPDDSGDDDVTPPDDSGDDDVTPPDDSGDDDVTPPDDSGDDDVTPPDDSGDDDDTPPDDSVITFSNGVTIDKGKDTLTFDSFKLDNGSVLEGAVWNYSEQDNQWQLTTADGKTLNVTGWDVTDANAAVIEGTQENGLYWKYDSRGYLIIADDNTTVISGDDQAHNSDRGMDISGQDRTGVIISGDRTVNTLTGDSSVTDGATGMVISGDGTTNTISGHSTVDNATGALISGNGTTTNFAGDIAVSGGGTAIIIDGDNATIKNTGTSNISGAGSTGTVIDGNNARVNNDGDMTITDGGTGGHITGDNVVIDNAGSTTVSGADATALYIEGDNALVINEGNQTISGGAVGTRIDGDDAHTTNTGDIAVDGAGSAAVIINGDNGTLTINGGANALANYGTLDADAISTWHSLFNEEGGSITTDLLTLNGDVTFYNDGDFTGSIAGTSYTQEIVNTGDMTVAEDGKALVSGSFYFYNQEGATLTNSGSAVEGGENTIINMTRVNDSISQVNSGTITATNGYSAITTTNGSNSPKWIWNTATGVINGINPDAPLINLGRGYNFGNQGTINVQGDNAVAISGGTSSYVINLVNSGTINVGTEQGKEDGTNGTGLIGIKGNGNATTINNTADGVINVYADDSYAFGGKTKAIINNGEINLLCDSGCDIYAPGTTGTQNDHNGTADIVIPDATTAPTEGSIPTPPADPNAPQQLSNYIVGTNADGSSGTLKANNLVIGDNVKVDTGFTSGTADTTVVVDNAFTGSNIQGADNITSTSVVWNAQGSQDADGNVDVTMTKNAYADVATDSSVSDVASALDAGYTNNELYTSLNVGTTAELNSALKQVSGAQATTVFREARVLSNRFTMLADAAPQIKDGLAFNVVAKGDPRAELGNDTQYDMLALRQTLDLTASQNLTLEYGIARLDGDGSKTAGDNGLTGGYSQFFGLKHSMAFDEGLAWNNSLRYDVHNLDSSRSVAYGDVNKIADSDMRQQYLEFRSEGAKTFTMMGDALKVTPYAGVKFRHTMEDGYKERSAGDFNLSMNSGNETAVDSIVGLKLDYAGKDGWSATATLEGGPNLSYSKSQRTASLQGAAGQSFGVDDGQKGGGINGLATIGVKYSSNDTALHLDAYQWKEDSISDKGFMLNVKKTFR
ncbi:autotransporter domain-containing protein [Salmonella enterica]|nr:autotransporter domain-containing protein [Salmonella enterica]